MIQTFLDNSLINAEYSFIQGKYLSYFVCISYKYETLLLKSWQQLSFLKFHSLGNFLAFNTLKLPYLSHCVYWVYFYCVQAFTHSWYYKTNGDIETYKHELQKGTNKHNFLSDPSNRKHVSHCDCIGFLCR